MNRTYRLNEKTRIPLLAPMLAMAAGIVLTAAPSLARAEQPAPGKTVSIGGHAFHFGPSGGHVRGGEVVILERPGLKTLTGKRGAFRFDGLPVGSDVTLVFRRKGYMTVQTGTFRLEKSLDDVTFQVPPHAIYAAYSMLLGLAPDPNFSQVATTVTRFGESMYHSDGPTHGEPGATVTIDPPLPAKHGPIYFNLKLFEHGMQMIWPDRSLKATTFDGGVLFLNVPDGEYTLRAHKSGVRFKPVRIKCGTSQLVNPSPPHGLQALNRLPDLDPPTYAKVRSENAAKRKRKP